jgi:hypothetical protein
MRWVVAAYSGRWVAAKGKHFAVLLANDAVTPAVTLHRHSLCGEPLAVPLEANVPQAFCDIDEYEAWLKMGM